MGISHALIYFPLYEKSKIWFKDHLEKPEAETLSGKYVFISAVCCKCKSFEIFEGV
jgi:hypothetical protein